MNWFVNRMAQLIPLLFFVITVNFVLIHAAPGDPGVMLAGVNAPPDYIKAIRKEYGLDKPIYVQLALYFEQIFQGNFGYSFTYNMPVFRVIGQRLIATLALMATAFVIAITVGVNLGIAAALRPGSWLDSISIFFAVLIYGMPDFWLAILAMLAFGLGLRWFPVEGLGGLGLTGIRYYASIGYHLILPATVVGLRQAALYSRLARASMLEALEQDYMRTARAKGVKPFWLTYKHALRNAMLSIVTVIGLRFRFLLTGAVLVEVVFGWPGVGNLTYLAIFNRDYYLLMSIFIVVSLMTFLANLVTDMSYAWLDPRIKY